MPTGPQLPIVLSGKADVVGIHLADLGSPLGGPVLHALGQLVEAVRPVLDELGVVPSMLDDLVHERQREGGVGAGTGLQATSACLDISWKRTSMTMSFVMPAAWFLNTSLHQAVSMAGFCPHSTAQWSRCPGRPPPG